MPRGSLYEVYKEGEPKEKRFISTRLLHVEEKREDDSCRVLCTIDKKIICPRYEYAVIKN